MHRLLSKFNVIREQKTINDNDQSDIKKLSNETIDKQSTNLTVSFEINTLVFFFYRYIILWSNVIFLQWDYISFILSTNLIFIINSTCKIILKICYLINSKKKLHFFNCCIYLRQKFTLIVFIISVTLTKKMCSDQVSLWRIS